jgi:isopentenyl-diphosphate Delta-isomerase
MTEEFLDIVDENNELTGQSMPRSRVHTEGIWHRTVHIYLFRKNNDEIEFLVHHRSQFKDLNPDKWDTRFGGHIKAGISLENGAKSELKEEIGLEIDTNKLIEGIWNKRNKFPNCEFTKTYYFEFNGNIEDLKFNDGEVQEVKWMSIEEVKGSMLKTHSEWSAGINGFMKVSDYLVAKLQSN